MSNAHPETDIVSRQQQLEETVANLMHDVSQLSTELYDQQKEIMQLRLEVQKLRLLLQHAQTDSGILRPGEDRPPPHY